ncbi:DUF3307 domain-containing protein [Sulfitobacter aestuarii]|uniref:DUF3307 domain-containing protein n=1 Tax=Sulfitobacter aestuarii TaxID=2161676 RepID=A0ABW5U4J2_9RHOB
MAFLTSAPFLALLTAHLLADFVFQTDWMVAHKRNPGVLALHGLAVFLLSVAALGGHAEIALLLALVHLGIDAIKVYSLPDTLLTYLADQAAHLLTLAVIAVALPDLVDTGLWAGHATEILPAAVLLSGGIAATLAGGPAVGLLMARYRADAQPDGLPNAGRTIGLLERGLIYLMVLIGEPTGIGFLIAAKSILRFDTVSRDRSISEYVIIGTLASFGWALLIAFAAKALAISLPPA